MLWETRFADHQGFPGSLAPSFQPMFVAFIMEQQHLAVFRDINPCLGGREGVALLVPEREQSPGSDFTQKLGSNSDEISCFSSRRLAGITQKHLKNVPCESFHYSEVAPVVQR